MVNRTQRQVIIVPIDPERLSSERPVKPRKPPEQRTPIQSRGFDTSIKRPIPQKAEPWGKPIRKTEQIS